MNKININEFDHLDLSRFKTQHSDVQIQFDGIDALDKYHVSLVDNLLGVTAVDAKLGGHETAFAMAKADEVSRILGGDLS